MWVALPGARQSRWRRQRPDWWLRLALIVTAVAALLVVGTFASVIFDARPFHLERSCGDRPFTCGIWSGAGVTFAAIAGAYTFWALLRNERLVALYLKRMPGRVARVRRIANRILPGARRAARRMTIVPRDDLYELVIDDVRRSGPRPQLILGPIGTGKTCAMTGLARELAAKRFVPVPVNLARAGDDVDFLVLAREQFKRTMRRDLLRDDEDFGVWQRLQRDGRLVVLVDGLGAPPGRNGDWHDALRDAIRRASEEDYGLVIAARPEDVPAGLNVAVFELGALDTECAAQYVLAQADRDSDNGAADVPTVRHFIDAAEITETPFYLDYIVALHQAQRLRTMRADYRPRFGLRLDLLKAYLDALKTAAARPDTRLLGANRPALVGALVSAARQSVDAGQDTVDLSALPDPHRSAEDGISLGLLERADCGLRFRHTILGGYLAAVDLADATDPVRACANVLATPGARGGAVAAAIAGGLLSERDPDDARAVAQAIVAEAGRRKDGTSFPLVTAAADIATLLDPARVDPIAADVAAFVEARRRQPVLADHPTERIRLANRLRRLGGQPAARALWQLAGDRKYLVRLTAARRLAELGDDACAVLKDVVDDLDAVFGRADGVSGARLVRVGVEAWMLPTLAATARADAKWVGERLERWLQAPWSEMHPALEASLAQGFKFAAIGSAEPLRRPVRDLGRAIGLLEGARFWYSKVCLMHAITVWEARCGAPHDEANRVLMPLVSDPHLLVLRTARQCQTALVVGLPHYIWSDEAAVSARATSGPWPHSPVAEGWRALEDEACKLMADIAVALNLMEGDHQKGSSRRARMEAACEHDLPDCLGPPPDLERLRVDGRVASAACRPPCTQHLCPYPARAQSPYRGEFTEAFCRHQASIRRRHSSRALWAAMEQRAET